MGAVALVVPSEGMILSPVVMSITSFVPRTTFLPWVMMTLPPKVTMLALVSKSAQSPVAFCPSADVTTTFLIGLQPRQFCGALAGFVIGRAADDAGARISCFELCRLENEIALLGAHVARENGFLSRVIDI